MDKKQPTSDIDLEQARLDQKISANKLAQEIMIEEHGPFTTLYSWKAPERVFSPKSRIWYVVVATIAMLFIVYSALTSNIVLIFLIVVLVLVVYSMNSIKPHDATYSITSKGISAFDSLYMWRNLIYFWATKRGKDYLINVEYREKPADLYYQRMIMLVSEGDLKTIVGFLIRHVDYMTTNERSMFANFLEGTYIKLLDIVKVEDITESKDKS